MSLLDHWPALLLSAAPPLLMAKSYSQMNNMVTGYASRHGVKSDPCLRRFYASPVLRARALMVLVAMEALFNALYWASFRTSPTMLMVYALCAFGMTLGIAGLCRSYIALYEAIKAARHNRIGA